MKQAIHKYQTSDYMEWDVMLSLIRKLYRDGNYRMSLLIGCGCFFGLRISDILTLTWSMLLNDDKFTINEKKTNKRRTVKINSDFQQHIKQCHDALHITNDNEKCFLSQKKMVYSTQRINVLFKEIKKKYNLKIEHFSMALIKLSELFNHSNIAVTKIYLGLREKELMEAYDLLDF